MATVVGEILAKIQEVEAFRPTAQRLLAMKDSILALDDKADLNRN